MSTKTITETKKVTLEELLSTEFIFKFVKTRNVKSPEKANLTDAGIDFYVPTDLNITEFTKNKGIYYNDSHIQNYHYSPIFVLKNADGRSLSVRFRIENNNLCYYNANKNNLKIDDSWKVWIEDTNTVVSEIILQENEKILIPSGIHVKLPPYIFLDGQNKSGIASKRGLYIGAATIDNEYQGEIHINLTNVTAITTKILAGDKIAQFIPHFQPYFKTFEECASLDILYKGETSTRGIGGFGSTTASDTTVISTTASNAKTKVKTTK